MRSPYSDNIEAFVHELNRRFIEVFDLSTPYRRDDIIDGERYGIVNFRSFRTDNIKRARNARVGFAPKVFGVEILLTTGHEDWLKARAAAASLMVDLDHSIPVLKQEIEQQAWIYELEVQGDIIQNVRQTLSTPHYWLVDVTCDALCKMQVYTNESGEHVSYPYHS